MGRGINVPTMSERPLENQVALVTGAGRRIGRVIALTLARAGAHVIVNYNASRRQAESTVAEIEKFGVQSFAARANVASAAQVKA